MNLISSTIIFTMILLMIYNAIKGYNTGSFTKSLLIQSTLLLIFSLVLYFLDKSWSTTENFDTTNANLTLITKLNGLDYYLTLLPGTACVTTPPFLKDCPTNFPVLTPKNLMDDEYASYKSQIQTVRQEFSKTLPENQSVKNGTNYYHMFQISKIPGPNDRLQLRGYSKLGLDHPDYQISSAFFDNVISGPKYAYNSNAPTSENLNFLCSASPQNIREKDDIANIEVILEELSKKPTLESFTNNTNSTSQPTDSVQNVVVHTNQPLIKAEHSIVKAENIVTKTDPVNVAQSEHTNSTNIATTNVRLGFKVRITMGNTPIYNKDGTPQTITYYVAKCKDATCMDQAYGVTPTPRVCLVPDGDLNILYFNLASI